MKDYAGKLHLVAKFESVKHKVNEIHQLTKDCEALDKKELADRVEAISHEILEEL